MSTYEIALIAGVAVPLLMFAVLAFFGARIGKPAAGWCAVAAVLVSLGLSCFVAYGWLSADDTEPLTQTQRFPWLLLGITGQSVPIYFQVKLDALTVMMYLMVTLVSTCIFIFSVGYMAGHSDEVDGKSKYHRFFAYLCLFEFSMLGLVISSSLFFLFVFWELVGLCSYLLIGFYFDKKYASNAAMKAFITNRVGDFGFIAGLMMVLVFLGTFNLDTAAGAFQAQSTYGTGIFAASINLFGFEIAGSTLATVMGVCLFCGAIGKSAQFPLHVWLPDAMAGPTPVSALIHAATMVAAGVYLVARIFRLLTPDALMVITIIGCITLTITALIAIVQTDIKKVLAYSTLSQLGYMIFGLGIGAWVAALFHLITHAFFKAMLFLGSGQVIEGCHHVQDIRQMGGLRKKMPVTCWTFFIGVLAIAGFGIPGLVLKGDVRLGLGGFFSKDEILVVAYERAFNWEHRGFGRLEEPDEAESEPEDGEPGSSDLDHAALGGARVILAADRPESAEAHAGDSGARDTASAGYGEAHHGDAHGGAAHGDDPRLARIAQRVPALPDIMFYLPVIIAYITPFYMMRCWWLTFMGKPRDKHVYEHAHESPLMYVPLIVLAIGTVVAGYWGFRDGFAEAAESATEAALVVAVDGEGHVANTLGITHDVGMDPHKKMIPIVGFAWIVGMGVAWLIYRKGFALADRLRRIPPLSWAYVALEQKLFFDHVYDTVLVGGTKWVLAGASRLVDTYIIDGVPNLLGRLTVASANISGRVFDALGVDGLVNGLADTARASGDVVRQPQTGRLRNYVLFGTAGAGLVLIAMVILVVAGSK